MAILVRSTLLLLAAALILCLLPAPTTSARPLKTLFITFTIDSNHHHHHHHNPNPNSFIFIDSQNPTDGDRSITILSDEYFIDRSFFQPFSELDRPVQKSTPFWGLFGQEGIDIDSMMDRSKDVVSVVVALLFGVGCGSLTAATMYFAWMLIVGDKEDYDEEIKDGIYHYDEILSPRKGEYTKIPEDAAPAQAKDVV